MASSKWPSELSNSVTRRIIARKNELDDDALNREFLVFRGKVQEGAWGNAPYFKRLLTDALLNVVVPSRAARVAAGTSFHDWSGIAPDEGPTALAEFFQRWWDFSPSLSTGLQFIERFGWLYYESPEGLELIKSSPAREMMGAFVELVGKRWDSTKSSTTRAQIEQWISDLGGMAEVEQQYVLTNPENPLGFDTFNELFARELKHPRPVDSESGVAVASADCVVNMIADRLTPTTPLPIKAGKYLNVHGLLDGSKLAERFVGGTAVSQILMPNTYHRYHAPIDGLVVESSDSVSGAYFGIHDFPRLLDNGNVGYGYGYADFEDFRRGYMLIKTKHHGYVGMVPVGLNTIASVIFADAFQHIAPGGEVPIAAGDEVGCFLYGGSMNILLFEPGVFSAVRLNQGQRLGQLGAPLA